MNLRACLQSVAGWVDEIVILDSGSDNTAEIAVEFQANYRVETDWQGYGRQRQMAQELVTAQWCFWLDADERVTPELQAEILRVCAAPIGRVVYAVPRLNWVFG